MKKALTVLTLVLLLSVFGFTQNLATVINALGARESTLTIFKQYAVTDDLTIPANITLEFLQGGSVTITAGKTLTINGHIEAGLYQIFEGDGSVIFGSGAIKEVYPQWWGVDSTNDHLEINEAIDALPANGGIVYLSERVWVMGGGVPVPNYVSIIGSGPSTKINFDFVQDIGFYNTDYPAVNHHIVIANMFMDGFNKTNDPIEFKGCYNCTFRNLWITRGNHDAIELVECYNCLITEVIAWDSNVWDGIELEDSYNCIVSNCICHDNKEGIEVSGTSHDNLIVNNLLLNNDDYGLIMGDGDNEAYGNMMRGNGIAPFWYAESNVVFGSHLENCKARAYRTTSDQLNLVSGVWTKVELNDESYDKGNNFDDVVNFRYTAPYTGFYLVSGSVKFEQVVADKLYVAGLYKDDALFYPTNTMQSSHADVITSSFTDIIYLAAGSYIELWAMQSSGVNTVDVHFTQKGTYLTVDIITMY